MLKELSIIANDLLGLHGYPRQPFGQREAAASAAPADHVQVSPPAPALPRETAVASPHC